MVKLLLSMVILMVIFTPAMVIIMVKRIIAMVILMEMLDDIMEK